MGQYAELPVSLSLLECAALTCKERHISKLPRRRSKSDLMQGHAESWPWAKMGRHLATQGRAPNSVNPPTTQTDSSAPKVLFKTPSRILICFANFERPSTPRSWLRSLRNFAETRFRRFPTFHFSMPQKNLSTFCLFFCLFARFLRSYAKTDATSRFLAIFCSR